MKNLPANDRIQLLEMLNNALVGHLGLMDAAGYPRVIPLNFVFAEDHIFFHGRTLGEKYSLISLSPKVTFSVDVPYSIIPSYWMNPERGCSITQFFKSILIRGQANLIHTRDEVIFALRALMEKYQPDGGYGPLIPDSPTYDKAFDKVATFRINIEEISIKTNFGQRMASQKLDQLLHKLQERNTALDLATILEIQKRRSNPTS